MDRVLPKSLKKRWNDPRALIQVFTGPRQVGKTTAALALMDPRHSVYADADLPSPPTADFITGHWQRARQLPLPSAGTANSLPSPQRTLVLDEVQKIPRWSEAVKQLWDEDRRNKTALRVCLLGSSAILMEKGLSESLTGRFEVSYFPHWTYGECRALFGATLEEFADVGGYPKAYDLREDHGRLESYLRDSILEPTLGRDILALHSVDKPALLRQLFWYVSRLPSQIVSYEKILSHLQGKGNSATLVHYADLLATAFLLVPLGKFSRRPHRTKRSIPKWIVANPGLVDKSVKHANLQGFVFENLIGSHLLNVIFGQKEYQLQFWREEKARRAQAGLALILADLGDELIAAKAVLDRGPSKTAWLRWLSGHVKFTRQSATNYMRLARFRKKWETGSPFFSRLPLAVLYLIAALADDLLRRLQADPRLPSPKTDALTPLEDMDERDLKEALAAFKGHRAPRPSKSPAPSGSREDLARAAIKALRDAMSAMQAVNAPARASSRPTPSAPCSTSSTTRAGSSCIGRHGSRPKSTEDSNGEPLFLRMRAPRDSAHEVGAGLCAARSYVDARTPTDIFKPAAWSKCKMLPNSGFPRRESIL